MDKKATINDVAKEAKVSIATVSRYLANNGYPVKEQTAKKIEQAVLKLSYTPNIVGRMLKTSKSMDIGVIIPTILNPYYPSVIYGIEKKAREKGYNILLCNSQRSQKLQKQYIDTLIQKQIKGLIISSISEDEALFNDVVKKGIDLVSLEDEVKTDKVGKVLFDYEKGAYMAIEHLILLGHTKIAFLTSPLVRKSRLDILKGYKRCLLEHHIRYEKVLEIDEENEYENGALLTEKLLKEKVLPTAVLAVNDMLAFGIMQSLTQHGLMIPKDMSIVGFDDLNISKMMNPALTTISQPSEKTGEIAASMLFDMFDGGKPEKCILQPQLIIRASTNNLQGDI